MPAIPTRLKFQRAGLVKVSLRMRRGLGYSIGVRPEDTSSEAWKVFLDLQRRTPPGEKIRRAMSLSKTVHLLSEAGLRRKFPEAGDREIFLRRARLTLGDDLFRKAYSAELTWL
jgi:hypothetical protein